MRTPKEYVENLRGGIVTETMLSNVLYSYSKRAKNYRDRIRQYNHADRWNGYLTNSIIHCEETMKAYYGKKSDILKLCDDKITGIHSLTFENRRRVYDYNKEWRLLEQERMNYKANKPSKVVWMNQYYDHTKKRYIEFCDVMQYEHRYFLYYELGQHSFHRPIETADLERYKGVEIVELQELTTYGEDISDLLSIQFCDKVWKCVMSKGEGKTN